MVWGHQQYVSLKEIKFSGNEWKICLTYIWPSFVKEKLHL
jgi:hypothetical protein